MVQFEKYLLSIFPDINRDTLSLLIHSFVRQEKKKGDLLLRQGEPCRNLYFVSEGICRSFSEKEGNDITTWFSFKNDFITSFTSFFTDDPSYESIEMLSDGVLYQISHHKFFNPRTPSLELEQMISHFKLVYTLDLEKRLFFLQTLSATERYKQVLEQQPHLIQLIPNKHLASYLGITRETLSRIRANIN